ncbi:MAG TPA: sulfatase-like hydrolase/transferase, partial [Humisphaera sp.]
MRFTKLLMVLLAIALAGPAAAAAPPNVVFVLLDDMGYADLSCYGEKRVQTKHIDRLAAEGVR